MKFKTIAKEFQKALGVVEGIIPARTPLRGDPRAGRAQGWLAHPERL
jgi:hypothetical protein